MLDTNTLYFNTNLLSLHCAMQANIMCAGVPDRNANTRCKTFSFDFLRFENERLETFVGWPVTHLSPEDLAVEGFYYQISENCISCFFCHWKPELSISLQDIHNSHESCPFKRGNPVGNVPMESCIILDNLFGRPSALSIFKGRELSDNGIFKHDGPKWEDYVTVNSRHYSFANWPECFVQSPKDLAEAGFFYCGVRDCVICFYCSGGLQNLEIDDNPLKEHARWYHGCGYVYYLKGQNYIDKVSCVRPPYANSTVPGDGMSQGGEATGTIVEESDLDVLMNLDIMQSVSRMQFSESILRMTLRLKLERTGLPFFTILSCVNAVLQQQPIEGPSQDAPPESQGLGSNSFVGGTPGDSAIQSSITHPIDNVLDSAQVPSTPPQPSTDVAETAMLERLVKMTYNSVESSLSSPQNDWFCIICMNKAREIVFLPCSHCISCIYCTAALKKCPCCRKKIISTIKIEFA